MIKYGGSIERFTGVSARFPVVAKERANRTQPFEQFAQQAHAVRGASIKGPLRIKLISVA